MADLQGADNELIARVVARDRDALEALYDRYAPLALGLALKILGERAVAEEVVQEAFWRIWRNPASFDAQRGTLLSWMFGIVHNLALDELRRRRSRPPQVETAEEQDDALANVAGALDVAEYVGANLEGAQVRAALARLPGAQRVVIEKAYFEGLTHKEIAAELDEKLGTIHSRARMGLLKLRDLLADLRVVET